MQVSASGANSFSDDSSLQMSSHRAQGIERQVDITYSVARTGSILCLLPLLLFALFLPLLCSIPATAVAAMSTCLHEKEWEGVEKKEEEATTVQWGSNVLP